MGKMTSRKHHHLSYLIIVSMCFLFASNNAWAVVAQSAEIESTVKKIVMMMNIVSKEYQEGISAGKVVVPAEYEESKIFLDQAYERYQSLLDSTPGNPEASKLNQQFPILITAIQNKKDPSEIHSAVNSINAGLLSAFNIKLSQTPSEPVSLENGRGLYRSNCKVCHGASGGGDGPLASQFNPKPAVLADPLLTGDATTLAYDNFQIINVGIANTGMVGWADEFSEKELWDVTYFIRTFSNENVKLPLILSNGITSGGNANGFEHVKRVFDEVDRHMQASLSSYKEGNKKIAAEQSFDAYLTYEKIETPLITKRKDLGLRLESSFGRLQAEIRRNASIELVEKIHSGISKDLVAAREILTQEIGFTGLFVQSFSIIVREGFEAILIIAALITFLIQSRNREKLKAIYWGVGIGILASFLTAYILHEVLKISMASQELIEGWIMLVAVGVLFYVSYWLVSKIETAKWQKYITGKMQDAISTGSAFTLSLVAFLSVYREGFETVLFYKALYFYAGDTSAGIIPGFLAGSAVLLVVFYLINKLGVKVPIKWFFVVTSVFLYLMAFIFMGKGLHELQMGSQISITLAGFLPEVPWMGMYPTWETFIGQMVLIVAYMGALLYTFGIKPERTAQELKIETSQLQKNIATVHDLVEHISHHAKRCEIFLKDTSDQDLKELSVHLKEIDGKVHELFNQVLYFENQLSDEYDRLGQPIREKELH